MYKSDQSAVRPDEELAYLAITRPEVDQIVEPEVTSVPPLDSVPNMPSPSSTRVATPNLSPERYDVSPPSSPPLPPMEQHGERSSSLLGKRASEDRDDSSRSSEDRVRHKGDDFEHVGEQGTSLDVDQASEEFEMIENTAERRKSQTPSVATNLADLGLMSPPVNAPELPTGEASPTDRMSTPPHSTIPPPHSTIPPPLPPRPAPPTRKDTLASGLRFGESTRYRIISQTNDGSRLAAGLGGGANQHIESTRACL